MSRHQPEIDARDVARTRMNPVHLIGEADASPRATSQPWQ